ncbi:hypothetical protein HWI92_15780 [Dyadobacter sandarakinus]|uniref:DKNYY family protein n=1 Tax=Dyadobacter sandarakinus TaxID=2747268 RepID=A0ABX7IFM0_9BACT|nr:hypothetical protein HWI92_15780 [Dyadobacter sandarakinus]
MFAQDSDIRVSAVNPAAYPISLYKTATAQTQNLYNGRQYYLYDARNDEHQFFQQSKWRNGVIMYDGQAFDSIPMLYDIVRDELVIRHVYGDHLLLQSEKVANFWLLDHHFKRMESGKDVNASMRSGFYDLLYEGKTQAIARRSKSRQEKIQDKRVIALFPPKNFYYVRKDSTYHPVHSRKSFFALFPEHKRDFRRTLREKNLRFRRDREMAIISLATAYDKTARP